MAAKSDQLAVNSLVKWAGGKKRLAPTIEQLAMTKVDFNEIDTYVEPFAGGASMFLYMVTKYHFKRQIISDFNPDLINVYRQVRDNPIDLVTRLQKIQQDYNCLSDSDEMSAKKAFFYDIREQYNTELLSEDTQSLNHAVLFLFLNKADFNGLYRVNSKGLFNVPFGRRKKLNLYDHDNLMTIATLLKDTEILVGDYQNTAQYADKNTFFYLDPPYRPLTNSASFTSYTKSDFNDNSQKQLAEFAKKIANQGAHFALSNSDPHQSDPEDDFFDDLYASFDIKRIQASRMISATSRGRGNVSELLIVHWLRGSFNFIN